MLKGEAKKEYQKKYMKNYMKVKRSKQSVKTLLRPDVKTPVQPDIKAKLREAGLNLEGNRILDAVQSKSRPVKEESNTNLPVCNEYNFKQFNPGDRVRVKRGKGYIETVIPELDASGQAIPDYW